MDHSSIFQLVFLMFELMFAAALLYIPYKIFMASIRGIWKCTLKTAAVIFPALQR